MLNDEKKRARLEKLLSLMKERGSRTEPVRQLILRTEKQDPGFKDLAMALILCFEAHQAGEL